MPVSQERLVVGQHVQLLSIDGDDFASQVFGAEAPVAANVVLHDEIAKVVLAHDLHRLDAAPSPSAANDFDQAHAVQRLVDRRPMERAVSEAKARRWASVSNDMLRRSARCSPSYFDLFTSRPE